MNTALITQDINELAKQPSGQIEFVLAEMTSLMRDTDKKVESLQSQNWFQRMCKTLFGKNKATQLEIQQNHDQLNAYLSQAISILYQQGLIRDEVIMSLGTQLNQVYAEHIQLKENLGAFVTKLNDKIENNQQMARVEYAQLEQTIGTVAGALNEKIDHNEQMARAQYDQLEQMLGDFVCRLNDKIESVDNFHTLLAEIDKGFYSKDPPIVAICKVMSQFDNDVLKNPRKLELIKASLQEQNILTDQDILLVDYLQAILALPIQQIGQIHLELGTIRSNFLAITLLDIIEHYHFLPDLARKMKNKQLIIDQVIQDHGLDSSVSLQVSEIYDDFIQTKIDVKNGLVPIVVSQESCEQSDMDIAAIVKLGDDAYDNKNYTEAMKYFLIAAEKGNVYSQWMVGSCYRYGLGVPQDHAQAFQWLKKAADQGDQDAQYDIGCYYYNGTSVAQDYAEAFQWFKKAAEQGNLNAQIQVGVCYKTGKGVAKDEKKVFEWYLKAAEQGHVMAQVIVGGYYFAGTGVDANPMQAKKWYTKAADQGDEDAKKALEMVNEYLALINN